MTAGLREISAAVGQLVATERGAFAVLGAWAPALDDARAVETVARLARRHAWRAEQLADQLFGFGSTSVDELTSPDSSTTARLAELASARGTDAQRRAAADLLEVLAASVEELAARCTPVADAALLRTLRIVGADLRADRDELARG